MSGNGSLVQGPNLLATRRFVVPACEVQMAINGMTPQALHDFLMSLVEPASTLARPPISKFSVGAVGLASSGAIYVGVNIEFPGVHLNNSIHAEQCLLVNCMLHGEEGIQVLAVSEAPCGHCRQFYSELTNADDVRFVFGQSCHWLQHHPSGEVVNSSKPTSSRSHAPRVPTAYSLEQLLPARFGPIDMMSDGEVFPLLLAPQSNPVQLAEQGMREVEAAKARRDVQFVQAVQLAEHWAQKSYSPYTKSPSGAAIVTKSGKVYGGGFAESAAFNPSLSPFHAAWIAAVIDHVEGFEQIVSVVLAQLPDAPVQHLEGTRTLLTQACPQATAHTLPLQRR